MCTLLFEPDPIVLDWEYILLKALVLLSSALSWMLLIWR